VSIVLCKVVVHGFHPMHDWGQQASAFAKKAAVIGGLTRIMRPSLFVAVLVPSVKRNVRQLGVHWLESVKAEISMLCL